MKKIITEQHFLNKYKGQNPHLSKRDKYKKECQDFVMAFEPNYFAVFRPKLSKLNYKTVDRMMQNTLSRFSLLDFRGSIDKIYYTVEEDRYKKSIHMNLLIKGEHVNALNLSTAMKRSRNEIGYFEPIGSIRNLAVYVNKHIAKEGLNLGLQGIVETEQALKETQFQSEQGYEVFDNHPNKDFHFKQNFVMKYQYGWSKHPNVVIQ